MNEMVYVGEHRLVGEVIRLSKEKTTIQVYEETSGLKPGEEVAGAGCAISVKLAPGILNNIFDGIERPLQKIAEKSGAFIPTGAQADALDREKLWETHITVQEGDEVAVGSIIAEVPETKSIVHRVMLPPGVSGTVTAVKPDGDYTICDEIVTIRTTDGGTKALTMTQEWPIRKPRPVKDRYPADRPLVTGQRILDTLFPIAKGGTAAIRDGSWCADTSKLSHAAISPSMSDKALLVMDGEKLRKIHVDVVFPVMHGAYSEDGTLQGVVTHLIFKGVHFEMHVDCEGREWLIHSTRACTPGETIGMRIGPNEIHIMARSEG